MKDNSRLREHHSPLRLDLIEAIEPRTFAESMLGTEKSSR
jgi:hypothetical protein